MANRVILYLTGDGANQGVDPAELVLVGGFKRGNAEVSIDGSDGLLIDGADLNITIDNDINLSVGGVVTSGALDVNVTGDLDLSATDDLFLTATNGITTNSKLNTTSTATLPAIKIGSYAGDPSSLANGDLWYNSTTNKFRKYENSIASNFVSSNSATFVVHPTVGVGDYTTIQAAVDALPAEGGIIIVREGTYAITTAITLPDKSVTIFGINAGSVIIDLGSNAIYAFTYLHTSAQYRTVRLENLTIQGNGTASQKGFHINDPGFYTELILDQVIIDNVDIGVYDESCSGLEFHSVAIYLADRDGVMHYDSTTDLESTMWIDNCYFENINGTKKRGGIGGGGFANISNSRLDCGTGTTFTRAQITGTRFGADGTFTGSKKVSIGNSRGVEMSAIEFRGGAYLEVVTGPWSVSGLVWQAGTVPAVCIDVLSGAGIGTITGAAFVDATTAAIRTASTTGVAITGCIFASTGVHNTVLETGSADLNSISGCSGLSGGGGITIIGASTIVNGAKAITGSGSTSGSYVELFTHTNPKGLTGIGTIKNTGGSNDMQVKETVIDAYGVTDSTTVTTVGPMDDYLLDPQTDFGLARPPYVSYKVEIKHPTSATTYSMRHTTEGAI